MERGRGEVCPAPIPRVLRSPLHGMVSKKMLIGTAAGWRRNLRTGEPVRILEPYQVIIKGNPSHSRHSGVTLDRDGNVNRDELRRALAKGTVVVRLRPGPPA
ncbi:hypothetical protein OG943_07350 [Amycolatopsis sp. NBC_00345]|uniref:hypothetical protein n=1 Tax=Amycolatopsis sp. NBC_00345 TaxID=2975955 RepID=UPI002E27229F